MRCEIYNCRNTARDERVNGSFRCTMHTEEYLDRLKDVAGGVGVAYTEGKKPPLMSRPLRITLFIIGAALIIILFMSSGAEAEHTDIPILEELGRVSIGECPIEGKIYPCEKYTDGKNMYLALWQNGEVSYVRKYEKDGTFKNVYVSERIEPRI